MRLHLLFVLIERDGVVEILVPKLLGVASHELPVRVVGLLACGVGGV